MNGVCIVAIAAAAWCAVVSVAHADRVAGTARLIDGDTIAIGAQVVRLADIDAPETRQTCKVATRSYPCGERATDALARLIAGDRVECTGESYDGYERLIGRCRTAATDLNREMVRRGWAVAYVRYGDTYLADERAAARSGLGIWQGAFQRPAEYRRSQWVAAGDVHPEGCPIKGNISKNGRVYHTPWSRHYARTRIDTARGERWFCSEAEALQAGWRAPRR